MRTLHPVTLLVLAELAACGSPPPPRTDDRVVEPDGKSMPMAVDPPTTPRADRDPPRDPPRDPAQCRTSADCPPDQQCVLPFNGARTIPGPGTCRPHGPIPGGRPLFVDGAARVSPSTTSRAWIDASVAGARVDDAAERAWLQKSAFDEHASIAAFARTICQLLALGAPASLIERTQAALADEIRHASQTFAWIERLGGGAVGPAALPDAAAPIDATPVALLRDVVRGGCVGETLAAYEVHARASAAHDADLTSFYRRVCEDEARHAALAYDTARWLVATFPDLGPALDEELALARGEVAPEHAALLEPLFALLA